MNKLLIIFSLNYLLHNYSRFIISSTDSREELKNMINLSINEVSLEYVLARKFL